MNMLDYCRQYGDRDLRKEPFNEVDSLLLCQAFYVEIEEFIREDARMTIREIYEAYLESGGEQRMKQVRILDRLSPLTLQLLASSKRFADCVVYNCRSIRHRDTAEQFAAVMIDLPDRTTAVVFRGTDNTMIGWREDLMLSYGDIASQKDAVRYVNSRCSIFKRYRLIGHSKGGHLALYAAVSCSPLIRARIMQIISNDGPGLRPGSYREKVLRRLAGKYDLIVPEKDGVGTIYEVAENKKIVRCSVRNLISAHNMLTWQIEGNRVMDSPDDSYQTDLTRKVIVQFLKETTVGQRKLFVDDLFDTLQNANIHYTSQFAVEGLPLILRTLRHLSQMDGEAKRTAAAMFRILSENLNRDLRTSVSRKGSDISEEIEEKIREYRSRIGNIRRKE